MVLSFLLFMLKVLFLLFLLGLLIYDFDKSGVVEVPPYTTAPLVMLGEIAPSMIHEE